MDGLLYELRFMAAIPLMNKHSTKLHGFSNFQNNKLTEIPGCVDSVKNLSFSFKFLSIIGPHKDSLVGRGQYNRQFHQSSEIFYRISRCMSLVYK